MMTDPVVIGVIKTPHGVRGTVRVQPTGSGRNLREGIAPQVDDTRYEILSSRPTPKGFLVDLRGINSRAEAGTLRGKELVLERAELEPLDDEEVYVTDLIGLSAYDPEGRKVGTVVETFETAAHEVVVVRPNDADGSAQDIYVPFTLEHIPELDLEAGRLVVRPPEE